MTNKETKLEPLQENTDAGLNVTVEQLLKNMRDTYMRNSNLSSLDKVDPDILEKLTQRLSQENQVNVLDTILGHYGQVGLRDDTVNMIQQGKEDILYLIAIDWLHRVIALNLVPQQLAKHYYNLLVTLRHATQANKDTVLLTYLIQVAIDYDNTVR